MKKENSQNERLNMYSSMTDLYQLFAELVDPAGLPVLNKIAENQLLEKPMRSNRAYKLQFLRGFGSPYIKNSARLTVISTLGSVEEKGEAVFSLIAMDWRDDDQSHIGFEFAPPGFMELNVVGEPWVEICLGIMKRAKEIRQAHFNE